MRSVKRIWKMRLRRQLKRQLKNNILMKNKVEEESEK
jgi:hypothetical protein